MGNKDAQTAVAGDWINSRPAGTLLDVRTLTLSAPAGAPPAEPIFIEGSASGQDATFQEAFVIDVTGLPSGTVISLKNIRSDERRVGKECDSTGRSRRWP